MRFIGRVQTKNVSNKNKSSLEVNNDDVLDGRESDPDLSMDGHLGEEESIFSRNSKVSPQGSSGKRKRKFKGISPRVKWQKET